MEDQIQVNNSHRATHAPGPLLNTYVQGSCIAGGFDNCPVAGFGHVYAASPGLANTQCW
jgi:hypothetical protein